MGGGMTHDDIIRMAREAGFCIKSIDGDNEVMEGDRYHIQTDVVARFAALVAAAERERLTLDGVHTCHAECQRPVCRLTRERDALLEACRFYASMMGRRKSDGEPFYMTALDLDCGDRARAAIKQAEENK